MARATTVLLIPTSCAGLAAAAYAADPSCTKTYTFKFFEQLEHQLRVFSSTWPKSKTGEGEVIHANLTKTNDPSSKFSGYLSGLSFRTSEYIINELLTLRLKDVPSERETSQETKLFLRGIFGTKDQVQEFAVVGGTKELSGAFGSVTLTKEFCIGCRWIEGTVFVPDVTCLTGSRKSEIINL